MEVAQRLVTLEAVFEAIPVLDFVQRANLRANAGHERFVHNAGVVAEPIPELEFDQTLGWPTCAAEMAHSAERGLV